MMEFYEVAFTILSVITLACVLSLRLQGKPGKGKENSDMAVYFVPVECWSEFSEMLYVMQDWREGPFDYASSLDYTVVPDIVNDAMIVKITYHDPKMRKHIDNRISQTNKSADEPIREMGGLPDVFREKNTPHSEV